MRYFIVLTIIIFSLLAVTGCTSETPSTSSAATEETGSITAEDSTPPDASSVPAESPVTGEDGGTITGDTTKTDDETVSNIPPNIPEQTQPDIPEKEDPDTETDDIPVNLVFSASPIGIADIEAIVALGNMNPPGHVFPTDHIYFYISRLDGVNHTKEVLLYSPGDLTVTGVNAIEHLNAQIVDYNINMVVGDTFQIRFGHVSSLSEDVFGDTSSFQNWSMTNEYSTGGETYRWWSRDYDLTVTAGQVIGTAGGNPDQWALDLFVYDMDKTQEDIANPERWSQTWYLHAADPLSYYEEGDLFEQLLKLVDREISEGEKPPFGSVLQDIPGTAQGCWFLQDVEDTYPEDPHLALVHDNIRPRYATISNGNSVRNLPPGVYEFLPGDSGVLNRDFGDITPDGKTYGFEVESFNGVVIIHMPDSETLWIEALPGGSTNPVQWVFSANKTVFKR